MQWKDSFARKCLYAILAIWAVLAIVFAFCDLQISKAVVNKESAWADFFERYGEFPGLLMAIVALILIDASRKERENKYLYYTISTLGLLFLSFIMYLTVGYVIVRIHHKEIPTYLQEYGGLMFPAFIVIFLLLRIFVYNKNKEFFAKYAVFSRVALWSCLSGFLVVQILKSLWGRVRFKHLDADFANYTPWYLPQGPGTEHQSFPSGHTTFGWFLLPLILLVLNKSATTRTIVTAMVIAWGVAVGASRIAIGAHYASDVLFATGFMTTFFLLLYKKYYFSEKTSN